jgi:alpha-tubulin suppressor-like RCC1 family protein
MEQGNKDFQKKVDEIDNLKKQYEKDVEKIKIETENKIKELIEREKLLRNELDNEKKIADEQVKQEEKNIIELNNKNIIQISCGNEHCLALNKNGEVYSWGINEDGVLGFPNNNTINNKNNKNNSNYKITFKPTLINFFKENNIKIKYISSGSIHNIVITNSGLLYSFGCSKGGQLGIDENTLLKLYSSNKIKDDFSISTPTKIQNLENFQIKKVVCGEAHSIALTENGKVFVWGLGSYGQLGLGFSDENYEIGTGLNSSRRFVPIELTNDYDII